MSGTEDRVQYYREMAAAAMEHARLAAAPEIKQTYVDLAHSWNALAQAAVRFARDAVPGAEISEDERYYQ